MRSSSEADVAIAMGATTARTQQLAIMVARAQDRVVPDGRRRLRGARSAIPRLGRGRGTCPRRATGPRRRKPGEHLVAPRLLSLLVSRAVALPIELRPRVALFGLDAAAQLDALARELHEESRGRIHVGMAEERSAAGVREIRAVLGPRDTDVAEPTLLLELGFASALDRASVRKDPFLHPGPESDGEVEPLYGVHRDERRRGLRVLVLVDVGHERDLLEEARQLLVLWKSGELFGESPELLDVCPALLPLFGPVLEVSLILRERRDLVEQLRKGDLLASAAKLRHHLSEGGERLLLPFGDRRDDLGLRERTARTQLVLTRGSEERGARPVAETARRGIEDARERERIVGIPDQPQVRERVLHLAALIERHAADDLVCEPERAEFVFDRARLRVRPVEDGDIPRSVSLALTL